MTNASVLVANVLGAEIDFLGALLRGGISAGVVAALLLAARYWGRHLTGLIAGLPTVSGPALVWLALDRGNEFASQAVPGVVAAAVPGALFALAYAWLSLRCRRWSALLWASAASLLSLPLLPLWQGPLQLALALVTLVCTACLALMPRAQQRPLAPDSCITPLRAGVITVLVAGAVSALASLLAQTLGPYWAGVLTSPPLLAAAVALELHRQGCTLRVQDFLRGYTIGLIGRSVFAVLIGILLVPQGLLFAVTTALTAALLLSWGGLTWMQWRSRLILSRSASLGTTGASGSDRL